MRPSERGASRRAFVKSAVAIGGAAALSACAERESTPEIPTGNSSSVPDRQHAWNDALPRNDHGNVRIARHHVLLLLDYTGDRTPDDEDRESVESAFGDLERSYERSNDGLLFTVVYSRAYFEWYDTLLAGLGLLRPEAMAPFEDLALGEPDAVVHLASDYGGVVLGAEQKCGTDGPDGHDGQHADCRGVRVGVQRDPPHRRAVRTEST